VKRSRATPLAALALGAALVAAAAAFASRGSTAAPAPELALSSAPAAGARALVRRLPEPSSDAALDVRAPSLGSTSASAPEAATAIEALEQALRQGVLDPASWSTMVAAHAADLEAPELAKLAECACDAQRELGVRLAALELLRARGSREAQPLFAEFEAQLEAAAFGPDSKGTTGFAAAASLAAFGGAQARERMLDRLEAGADPRQSSVCLHGLREGADATTLERISARMQGCAPGAAQERLAAAAQGLAPRLAREPHGAELAGAARALIEAAGIAQLDALARRRLLHSAAALGEAHSQHALCELALDPRVDAGLALEAAAALRASPVEELTAVLEARLDDPRLDPQRRRELAATCDARRGGPRAR